MWRRATRADKARLIGACAVALLLVVGLEIQKHRERSPARDTHNPAISTQSPEFRLAAIQLGHRPGQANPTLRRFASILDILEADCPANTRKGLGDLTTKSLRELRRAGIAATPNQILGAVLGSTDMGSRSGCSGFFERYVERRRNGGPV
jgi:hypothetical protein